MPCATDLTQADPPSSTPLNGYDEAGILRPIHVFGALDPLTTILYFIAGAEVFDGLTWLRYSFYQGLCVYQANYGALHIGTSVRDERVRAQSLIGNIHYLEKLTLQLRKFTLDRDFKMFDVHASVVESEFNGLRARLKENR